jgi:DHA1 family multidrug resistance protein-like MFS transporter
MAAGRAWLDRWAAISPIFLAEFITLLGFGSLLPVMPLYFTDQGVDLATLGVVIAAWPAARLVGEPVFGWIADRNPRVPLMVLGLLLCGLFTFLPLVITGAVAFVVLRAAAGLASAIYDPAARGFLTDATPPERRGEAFGFYGAAQMGGLVFGPAIGALGSIWFDGVAFVFVFCGLSLVVAALAIAMMLRETGARGHSAVPVETAVTTHDGTSVWLAADADVASAPTTDRRMKLFNRGLVAALLINAGANFGVGTYDVIWSIFLDGLGAGLDLIGLTFAMFGLPVLVLSPFAGRLVDRRGSYGFIIVGTIAPAVAGVLYTRITDPLLAVPLIMIEATGFALLNPALYAVVAASSPPGRSSTAQGIFGAAGTTGFIVASLITGVLAATDIRYPFYLFSGVLIVTLVVGVLIGRDRIRARQVA